MRFPETSSFVAYRSRWRVLLAAVVLPLPLLVTFFRDSSLAGWSPLRAISFALLTMIWMGLVASLTSPIQNWRIFKAVLLAVSALLFGWLVLGLAQLGTQNAPAPAALLIVASFAVLVFIVAIRVRAPSAEDIRLARIADEPSGQPVAWWIKLLAFLMWAVLASFILIPLYEMLS